MTTRCVYGDRRDVEVVSCVDVDSLKSERMTLLTRGALLAADGKRNGVAVTILKTKQERTKWGRFKRRKHTVLVAKAE